jgi:hypothetical protein
MPVKGFLPSVRGFAFLLLAFYAGRGLSLGQTTFERTYTYTGAYAEGRSIQQTSDGGYIIVGYARLLPWSGIADMLPIKLNFSGDTLWTRRYGGSNEDQGYFVRQTTDGGYIIAGSTGGKMYLVKTDSVGSTLWTKTYEGGTVGRSVQQTSDGGYIIGGTRSYQFDMYLVKTNASGDTLWTRAYSGPDNDEGYSVQQTFDGGYVIAGWTEFNRAAHWETDVYLVKTDSSGDTLWKRTYGGTDWDRGYSVQQTSDSGYIIAGSTEGDGYTSPTHTNIYLIKTNSSGDTLWTRTLANTSISADIGYSVQQTSDGGYIIAGFSKFSQARGVERVYLVKTNSSGDKLWNRIYGSYNTESFAYSVRQTPDGGYVLAGTTESLDYPISRFDVYVVKTRPDGLLDTPDPPTLLQPADGAKGISMSPTLSWLWCERARSYRVQVALDSLFADLVVNDSMVSSTTKTFGGLANNTSYYWRVNASNQTGTSEYSVVWTFTTKLALPLSVALISPEDKATIRKDSIRFVWRAGSPGVERYAWELAADSLFSSPARDSLLTDTSKVVRALTGGQTYWWKVAAKNTSGWGPFSPSIRFTTLLTGVSDIQGIPHEFSLSQNYPNPFNPRTTIKYELPKSSEVRLSVYDMLSREVSVLVNDRRNAGVHEVKFDGTNLASGVYFYRLQSGDFTQTRRFLLLR